MKPTALLAVLLSLAASTTAQDASASSSASASKASINWSALRETLASLTNIPLPTKPANLDNISPPPRTLIPELVHAVPASALVQLMVPAQRSSLISDFKAGSTPAWYASLPTDVKSYVSVVKSQIADGALTKDAAQAQKTAEPTPTGGEAKAKESEGGAAPMAMPTGGVWAVGAAGAAGLMGVVLMV